MSIKKLIKVIFLLIFILFFVSGCSIIDYLDKAGQFEPPLPEPKEKKFATANNVFDDDRQIFFLDNYGVYIEDFNFKLGVKVNHTNGFVFYKGYIYSSKNKEWKEYFFDQETINDSEWINSYASTELNFSSDDFETGKNYIVAFSCQLIEDEWKCGRTNVKDKKDRWMLQSFYLYRP